MSNNYLKVGKVYTLIANTCASIPGASFLHGIHVSGAVAANYVIDSSYYFSVSNNNAGIDFSIPIAFTSISGDHTASIIYS